ncbi:MAG: PadR-like family transcriptional regulator [Sphingomonas bacterium]|nr:PadR-like family transcriptional regulator [Sphingomonas bacterium]
MFVYFERGGRGCHSGIRQGLRGGWGHHARHWGGRGARGEGRSRRMFDGGELRLVLLKLIADEPRHGYDLIREIENLTGGAYAPSPGVVYPTLTMLDDMGFIAQQQSEGAKKAFAITDAGTAELDANKELVDTLIARLTTLGEERQKTDSTSVRRAMGNLREVLINRLRSGDVDDEVLHQVVALIDEAAQKIERL